MIACLKHYPGRGASADDAHFGVSAVTLDRDTMWRVHLARPYRALCGKKGAPAVMLAHAIYPHLDPSNEIATVSPRIVNGILQEEIGFEAWLPRIP